MTAINTIPYQEQIEAALPYCLNQTQFDFGTKKQGKVRDIYDLNHQLLIVTTDRQSAFDRVVAAVPYKGQVLNLISAWWFEQTAHLIPNHLLAIPDPNVMVVKKCKVFPVEFVVRGYITGSTQTSLWTQYQKGVRHYCGLSFEEGLQKNQKLKTPVLTPTTKSEDHDLPISPEEIVQQGLMTENEWQTASEAAVALYQFGVGLAKEHGLILVDTKYEFGIDAMGNIMVIDELHTPDSSRYWLADSYQERFLKGLEPENIDKEFLRLWFMQHAKPYEDEVLPIPPQELIVTLSSRYIQLYEKITGHSFQFRTKQDAIESRILKHISPFVA